MKHLYEHRLDEMAVSRSAYCKIAMGLVDQIFENLALIRFAQENDIQTLNHWKSEFIRHVRKLQRTILKGSDNPSKRKNVLEEEWVTKTELNTERAMLLTILTKLDNEGVPRAMTNNFVKQCCKEVEHVIELCISSDPDASYKYVNR